MGEGQLLSDAETYVLSPAEGFISRFCQQSDLRYSPSPPFQGAVELHGVKCASEVMGLCGPLYSLEFFQHTGLPPPPAELELGREAYEAVISQQTAVQGWRQQLIREPAGIHSPSPSFSAE